MGYRRFYLKFLFLIISCFILSSTSSLAFASNVENSNSKKITPTVVDSGYYYPGTNIAVRIGDVLVTNNTSSAGLTGHAGIVNDNYEVTSIAGYGYHPENTSIEQWFREYPNEKVYRYNGGKRDAYNAGNWARLYVKNYKNATYGLTAKLSSFTQTYCSKIVWQAYYYGADINFRDQNPTAAIGGYAPYDIYDTDELSRILKQGSW
ncbi:YiiX/YebB-like N1pC/P60 family cysteine hydrolase [Brevibacillus laterosporus]|uniref:YiiX/YebB-like N1pC/P60 family cysteine hydrolase n=1 Tax=Brevibacillus laterosporus TaxID=1465 RepID=UPI000B9BBA49|nr:YiiX/YebB-like N1pC/P60 family cysteine hydrolase [Brevibacillus laterosporus]